VRQRPAGLARKEAIQSRRPRATSVTSISRATRTTPDFPGFRASAGACCPPLRRAAAWAHADHDAPTIVMATLALFPRKGGVLSAGGAVARRAHEAGRAREIRLTDQAEMFVRPLGDVESPQNHAHDEEEWLWP
jgi:hypothetical protein